jgi:hypothetical protein
MGRKPDNTEAYTIEQMNKVLACITDHNNRAKVKTWDDLWNVAYQWCGKNYKYVKEVSDDWGVAPMYLLLTALLYVEHPLLVGEGRSWKYPLVPAQAVILQVELNHADIGVPIKSTDKANRGVERKTEPVEKMQ